MQVAQVDAVGAALAPATRRVPRPRITPGGSITEYDTRTLVALVRHVRSNDVLRTREEDLAVVMRELGFQRRGAKIVAAIDAAQARV